MIRHNVAEDKLDEQIIKIRREGKGDAVEGHPGIPMLLDLNGIVETTKDKKKSYIYKIRINKLDNLRKINDICEFFNKLFYIYDIWYNSHIEKRIKVVCKFGGYEESKTEKKYSVCNEINFIDVGTMKAFCTKCKQPLDIVGIDVDIFKKPDGIDKDFSDLIETYNLQMDYDVKEKTFRCERKITKIKDDITTSSSDEDSNDDDSDDESEEMIDDDIDGIDWGIDFDSDDDDDESEEDELDKDEILDEIAIKCPEEVDNISSPEDWGNLRKNEMMIMSYEESQMIKEDERMRDKFILSKLYERSFSF